MGGESYHLNLLLPLSLDQNGDETVIYDSAQALTTFQKLYGLFPRIVGKGDCASVSAKCFFPWLLLRMLVKRLQSLLTRETSKISSTSPDNLLTPSEKIDCLVVLDRKIDMITPLLTQLTYEGLIDELIGIKNCVSTLIIYLKVLMHIWLAHVELPTSLVSPPAPSPANAAGSSTAPSAPNAPLNTLKKENKKKYHLTTTTDPLFGELRDLNFSSVGRRLNRVAHRLDEDYKVILHFQTILPFSWSTAIYRLIFSQKPSLNYVILLVNWEVFKQNTKLSVFVSKLNTISIQRW